MGYLLDAGSGSLNDGWVAALSTQSG